MKTRLCFLVCLLLLGVFLAFVSCGGGGSKPQAPRLSQSGLEPASGGSADDGDSSRKTDLGESPGDGGDEGLAPPPPEETSPDYYVFISLDYDFSQQEYPADPEKMFAKFRAEPTVKALEEMGFEFLDAPDVFILVVMDYTGVFKLAPGWTVEQAMNDLPNLFTDIREVYPAGSPEGFYSLDSRLMHKGLEIAFHHDVYTEIEGLARRDDPEYLLKVELAFRSDPDVIRLQELGYELFMVATPFYAGLFIVPMPDLPIDESVTLRESIARELEQNFPRITEVRVYGVAELFEKAPSATFGGADARGGAF